MRTTLGALPLDSLFRFLDDSGEWIVKDPSIGSDNLGPYVHKTVLVSRVEDLSLPFCGRNTVSSQTAVETE